MTVICFNSKGRAFWKTVPTGEFRKARDANVVTFTEAEKAWFRRPLTAERSE